ncbi:MAG TPA: FmdB family zinc ribbon protein [Bryobacteraceae bacterium]|jgi:putative FmdB family regulatory protein
MPLYEYRCSKCHQVFEVLQKFSDAPLTTHEECGGEVERLISAPGFQFKGSGWYITDYKNSGAKKSEGAKDDGKSGGKSDEKKESKTATAETAKAESKPAAASKSSE